MRNATGATGGKLMYLPHFVSKNHMGGEVLVLESNQNHARAEDTEVCPCLPAAMGNGGAMCR